MQPHNTPVPKPRDPRKPEITPDELSTRFEAVLSRPMDDLAAELVEYEAAYEVLAEALQDLSLIHI